MLSISRWMAAAILVTVFTVSAAAIPNFLSEKIFQSLPRWAQHRIVPGIEYQGGTRLVLAVDTVAIRMEMVGLLRDDVRKALREARVGLVQAPITRGDSVEVRLREDDLQRGLAVLQEYLMPRAEAVAVRTSFQPASGDERVFGASINSPSRPPDVVIESDRNLVRLTPSEFAIRERIQIARQRSIDRIRGRIQYSGMGHATVLPRGDNRIEMVALGIDLTPLMYIQY